MIPIILLFLLPSTISQYPSLAEATPLLALATAVDSTYPPVVPNRQYWGTFYYPWYGDGELPELTFAKDLSTSPLLGYTEPEVIRVNQTFYLYYRTDSSIAVAKSTDGKYWNDLGTVLTPSTTGWDSGEVISPSVIVERGTYYLFYEADDASNPGNRAIGLATSTNPAGPFTKHPTNPILTPSQPWEETIVGTPAITKIGATYYLFYHGFSDGKDRGGVAYSNNLLSWTREANNPILDTGSASSWDSEKVAPSDVYASATNLWLFYEGYNGTSWRIGLATGTPDPADGRVKSLTKQPAPTLNPGPPGSFDSHTIQLPTVVPAGPELWLYYSGNDGQAFRLGKATAPTPDTYRHWNESKPDNNYHNPPATWAAMYQPDLGLYDSMSDSTLDTHLSWLSRASFDFVAVSWWGQGTYEDHVFSLMLNRASSGTVKLTIYYELQDRTTAQIVDDLHYILNNYGGSPAFFKITNGTQTVPAIFVYMVGTVDRFTMTDRWLDARAQMYSEGTPVFISLKVFDNYKLGDNDLKVDSWHQYGPATNRHLHTPHAANISPGYVEYPELATERRRSSSPYEPLSRNLTRFRQDVLWMQSLDLSQVKFKLVTSFNEWHEGTQIEPGIPISHLESGFAPNGSSYAFTYIDIIRYRGQPADFSISTNPASLNITQGSSGTSSIVLRSLNGLEGTVTLSAKVLPSGLIVTFNPEVVTLTVDGTATSTLAVSSTIPGTYTVTIEATSGTMTRQQTLTVKVTSPTIFGLQFYGVMGALGVAMVVMAYLALRAYRRGTGPRTASSDGATGYYTPYHQPTSPPQYKPTEFPQGLFTTHGYWHRTPKTGLILGGRGKVHDGGWSTNPIR